MTSGSPARNPQPSISEAISDIDIKEKTYEALTKLMENVDSERALLHQIQAAKDLVERIRDGYDQDGDPEKETEMKILQAMYYAVNGSEMTHGNEDIQSMDEDGFKRFKWLAIQLGIDLDESGSFKAEVTDKPDFEENDLLSHKEHIIALLENTNGIESHVITFFQTFPPFEAVYEKMDDISSDGLTIEEIITLENDIIEALKEDEDFKNIIERINTDLPMYFIDYPITLWNELVQLWEEMKNKTTEEKQGMLDLFINSKKIEQTTEQTKILETREEVLEALKDKLQIHEFFENNPTILQAAVDGMKRIEKRDLTIQDFPTLFTLALKEIEKNKEAFPLIHYALNNANFSTIFTQIKSNDPEAAIKKLVTIQNKLKNCPTDAAKDAVLNEYCREKAAEVIKTEVKAETERHATNFFFEYEGYKDEDNNGISIDQFKKSGQEVFDGGAIETFLKDEWTFVQNKLKEIKNQKTEEKGEEKKGLGAITNLLDGLLSSDSTVLNNKEKSRIQRLKSLLAPVPLDDKNNDQIQARMAQLAGELDGKAATSRDFADYYKIDTNSKEGIEKQINYLETIPDVYAGTDYATEYIKLVKAGKINKPFPEFLDEDTNITGLEKLGFIIAGFFMKLKGIFGQIPLIGEKFKDKEKAPKAAKEDIEALQTKLGTIEATEKRNEAFGNLIKDKWQGLKDSEINIQGFFEHSDAGEKKQASTKIALMDMFKESGELNTDLQNATGFLDALTSTEERSVVAQSAKHGLQLATVKKIYDNKEICQIVDEGGGEKKLQVKEKLEGAFVDCEWDDGEIQNKIDKYHNAVEEETEATQEAVKNQKQTLATTFGLLSEFAGEEGEGEEKKTKLKIKISEEVVLDSGIDPENPSEEINKPETVGKLKMITEFMRTNQNAQKLLSLGLSLENLFIIVSDRTGAFDFHENNFDIDYSWLPFNEKNFEYSDSLLSNKTFSAYLTEVEKLNNTDTTDEVLERDF